MNKITHSLIVGSILMLIATGAIFIADEICVSMAMNANDKADSNWPEWPIINIEWHMQHLSIWVYAVLMVLFFSFATYFMPTHKEISNQ